MQPGPSDFLIAASLLNVDSIVELQEPTWSAVEDARARSAVSRGYYAAFRTLKLRLLPQRVEWRAEPKRFPKRMVHEGIHKACELALGEKHRLVREMKALLRRRNHSDYEFEPLLDCAEADDDLVAAEEAIDLINALTVDELARIALELHNFDAQARTRV